MSEPLYVDPEALGRMSRPYNAAAQDWLELKQHVADIRSRYYGAWGDDDLGQKFGPQFTEGLNQVEERVNVLGDTLNYYGDGLTRSGQIYGEAGDDAEQVSSQYCAVVEEVTPGQPTQTGYAVRGETVTEGRLQPALRMRAETVTEAHMQPGLRMRGELLPRIPGEEQPLLSRQRAVVRSVGPGEPGYQAQTLQPTRLLMPAVMEADPGVTPLEPMQRAQSIPGALAGANPPPGEFWSDGYWLYTPGGGPVAIESLESPYDHGAAGQVYEPGTVPQPASGVFPPAGQVWSDGVYLYGSDGSIRGLDTLDSPYDHL